MLNYKFDEGRLLQEIAEYIDSTYSAHYAGGLDDSVQFTEYFLRRKENKSEAIGAFRFNSQKYADRFGSKDGYNRKDVFKAIHYLIMMLNAVERYDLNGENKK